MSERKGVSRAMSEAQEELENLCELSSSATPDQLVSYKLMLKSWRNVWKELLKVGNVSQSEADDAMRRIENTCSKLGISLKEL